MTAPVVETMPVVEAMAVVEIVAVAVVGVTAMVEEIVAAGATVDDASVGTGVANVAVALSLLGSDEHAASKQPQMIDINNRLCKRTSNTPITNDVL